ncbi:PLG [Bugula neritina]|uniref:PLG n=1 Tax=Bugula neritina TaxID=10212 RepID=A0A7J7JBI5_BUGNE|nr:PLG [Bugula neritina]
MINSDEVADSYYRCLAPSGRTFHLAEFVIKDRLGTIKESSRQITMLPHQKQCITGFKRDCVVHRGITYAGDKAETGDGKACSRWDTVHTSSSDIDLHDVQFIDGTMADAGNKCRNPYTSDKYHPWCYTADDGSTWGYCEITLCNLEPAWSLKITERGDAAVIATVPSEMPFPASSTLDSFMQICIWFKMPLHDNGRVMLSVC